MKNISEKILLLNLIEVRALTAVHALERRKLDEYAEQLQAMGQEIAALLDSNVDESIQQLLETRAAKNSSGQP